MRDLLAFGLTLLLAATTVGAATPAFADPLSPTGDITELTVSVLYDGQAVTELDDGPNNGIVATNDVVGYQWAVTMVDLDDGTFTQTLPVNWLWDPASIVPLNSTTDAYRSTASISDDGRTLTAVITSLKPGNPVYAEFGALRAKPSRYVAYGSTYAAVLTASDASGTKSASAAPVTVVSKPQAKLQKTGNSHLEATQIDFQDGLGPVPSYAARFLISVTNPIPGTAIGSTGDVIAQPLVIRDTFTIEGPVASSDVHVTVDQPAHGTVAFTRTGDTIEFTLNGLPWVPDASFYMYMWVRISDLAPLNVDNVRIVNTVAPAGDWLTKDGRPFTVDTARATAEAHVYRPPVKVTAASVWKSLYAFTDQHTPDVHLTQDPRTQLAGPDAPLVKMMPSSEYATGTTFVATYELTPGTTDKVNDRMTNLVSYDFWDPAYQQIVDGQTPFVGTNSGAAPMDASRYTVQYTPDPGSRYPESKAWYSTIAAAGGVERVAGIRIAFTDGVWEPTVKEKFTLAVAFTLVGPMGTRADDEAAFAYDESPRVSASAWALIGGHTPTVAITSSTHGVMGGDRVGYTLTPKLTAPLGLQFDEKLAGFSVQAVLPPGLVSVDFDAVPAGWILTTTGTPDGGMTVRYEYDGEWDTSWTLPVFTYSVLTSFLAPTTQVLPTTAVIDYEGTVATLAKRTAVNSVSVQQVSAITEQKTVVSDTLLETGDTVVWKASWYNTTRTSAGTSYFVDVLPWDGDARGTRMHGDLQVASAEISGSSPRGIVLEYTTASAADVYAASPDDDSFGWIATDGVDLTGIPGITALRLVVADFAVTGTAEISLTVRADLVGMHDGDRLVNTVNAWLTQSGRLGESNQAGVDVVSSTIGGVVWLDPGAVVMPGVRVTLYDVAGVKIGETRTDAGGRYVFEGLRSGIYRTAADEGTLSAPSWATVVNIEDYDNDLNSDSGDVVLARSEHNLDVDYGYRFDGDAPVDPPLPPGAPLTETGGALPLTGGQIAFGLVGIVILLVSGGAFFVRRSRRGDQAADASSGS